MPEKLDEWIDDTIGRCASVSPENPLESELAALLVDTCFDHSDLSQNGVGRLLASAFDLLVAARYYGALSHTGWLYCPTGEPRLLFHYTNCCPRDVLSNRFSFHPSNKPESGRIGTATARLLLLFYQEIFRHQGHDEEILQGTEPVDAIIINRQRRKVLFAEIKASPLLTPPISVNVQRLTTEVDGETVEREHSPADNTNLFETDLQMLVPEKTADGTNVEHYFTIGRRRNVGDSEWAFRGLLRLLRADPTFFVRYFSFWNEALDSYQPKSNSGVFWLTNACGTPSPIPPDWPKRRKGEGYESVSDSKTSVGMDRTDDIKKGIYQVLKLGAEGKPAASKWDYKTGLVSNIHAARHFDEYLESLKDIVWTLDSSGKARRVSDLPGNQALYNLFDGIIALTSTLSRDDWIESLFCFHEDE